LGGEAVGQAVGCGGAAAGGIGVGGVELGVVTREGGPGPGEIVGDEIEVGEMLSYVCEGNVGEGPFVGG